MKYKKIQAILFISLIISLISLFLSSIAVFANDIAAIYNIPSFKRAPAGSPAENILKKAKVLRYSDEMPVKFSEITDIEKYTQGLKSDIEKNSIPEEQNFKKRYFNGITSKELNRFIQTIPKGHKTEILITARKIILDEPIRLRSFIILKGFSTMLIARGVDIAIVGEDIVNSGLKNLIIDEPKACGIMLINAEKCIFDSVDLLNSHDRGMVVRGHSSYIYFIHSRIKGNKKGGIMLQEGSHHVYIKQCEVSHCRDSSNWSAGIVITSLPSTSKYGIRDSFDENYFYPKELSFKKPSVPYKNFIEASYIHENQSTGIYIDGGNGNIILGNYITDNDKEGLCLDFYAVANIAESNVFSGNGFRRLQSDEDLLHDAVLRFGRLADGSAVSKLPNISLDNAAYNLIIQNTISNAAGDGVKIVRSGFRNIIGLNSIKDNNAGENSVFFFSGILIGSAGSDYRKDTSGIDMLPSIENICFGNIIYGLHRAGVFIDRGSTYNDIYDNIVMKQKNIPLIQNSRPNNIVGNNFTPKEVMGRFVNPKNIFLFILIAISFCITFIVIRKYIAKKTRQNTLH